MKPKIILSITSLFFITGYVFAQPPDTLWTRTFGGTGNEVGYGIQCTLDGGYVIAGCTESYGAGSDDVYLIKTDESGNEVWSQTYGGVADDMGFGVQQNPDGSYIIAGSTQSFGAGYVDVYLIKTDASGNQLWSRTYGGSDEDVGLAVQLTEDGGCIIAGYTESFGAGLLDVYLIKTDASGNLEWSQTYGADYNDAGYRVQQTSDGGYIIAGSSESFGLGSNDVYLIKTDEWGNEQWSQIYGNVYVDAGFGVQQTDDEGFIIAGITSGMGLITDAYLIKTNDLGFELWEQAYGGYSDDYGLDIQLTADGGYVIVGYTASFGAGLYDVYLIRTDEIGNVEWTQTFGWIGNDEGFCVQQTPDEGFVLAGSTTSFGAGSKDVYVVRLEGLGVTVTMTPYNPPIQIPAIGGSFNFNVALENANPDPATFDAWIMVQFPDLSWYGPVLGPMNITLPGMTTIDRDRTQNVPAGAPSGTYTYEGRVGNYPDEIWESDSFTFEKLATGDGDVIGEWLNTGEDFINNTAADELLPSSFCFFACYPNPFNPTTRISYTIPGDDHVSMKIYDVSGRLVATLIDGWRDAGIHEITFDGSGLPSGVYLVSLKTPVSSETHKILLLK